MDEDNEGSPKLDSYKCQEKTKVYSPLQQFLNLNMEMSDLYNNFVPFVLTNEQLAQNDFPRDSPDHPGRILSKSMVSEDQSLRHCARCGLKFHISDSGKYSSESACVYHPRKISSYQGIPGAGGYPCCEGNYMSKGCKEFAFHVSAEHFLDNVVFSKVREKRQVRGGQSCSVYALDCEMSYTTAGLEVTKIGVVSLDGLTVYETFVLPEYQILDYNTVYSGVTANDLKGVKTTISDVQAFLLRLLNKDSILVGHGLQNDLKALHLIHERIVDTSIVFPHQYGGHYRRSLKSLAEEHLSKKIQDSDSGHDCIEDARTCLELMLLKIKGSLHDKLPAVQDENKNSFLQNFAVPQQPEATTFSRKYMQPLYLNRNGTYCFIPHITETWNTWLDSPTHTCFC